LRAIRVISHAKVFVNLKQALLMRDRFQKLRAARMVALPDENVQHRLFKCRIGSMTMCFPAAINKIELDAAADWLAAVYPDHGIAKIGSGFTIPSAELNDVDLVASGCDKMFAEISGEPTRLQLQFAGNSLRREKRPFTDPRRFVQLGISIA